MALGDVEAFGESWRGLEGFGVSEVGEEIEVGPGGVVESWGGGNGDGCGDVGDAVVDDVFLDVDGVFVVGWAGGFEATTLVDGDVDDDGAGFHGEEGVVGDEFWGFCTGDEDAGD